MSEQKTKLSVVVPLYNEGENVEELFKQIKTAVDKLSDYSYEIIFVDDGSKDNTVKVAKNLTPLTLIELRRNFGQTAAFDAGFKNATGDLIVTLDGDLQNDPEDISLLLNKINEGFDVVSGWRKNRKDTLSKQITSRTANILRKLLFKDSIHDSGCALKVYKKECFDDLDLYGEMHRFIPALLEHRGYKITEVVVNHRPRINGVSKYGNISRGMKSLADMISVWFWGRYSARPLHIFGTFGIILITIGLFTLAFLLILRLFFGVELAERIWPLIAIFSTMSGVQLFTIGILADFQSKVYYRSHSKMNYNISNLHKL